MVNFVVHYLTNFFLISGAIILFSLPFLLVFWWRSRRQIRDKNPHFNYFMEQFFMSKESNWLVAIWAAAEAIIWFVIPEFLLILLVFMKIQRKRELVVYDLLGTVIGTTIAITLSLSQTTLVKLPYITPIMIDQVRTWYEEWGIFGIAFQPFSGVPFKLFNAVAGDYGFNMLAFIFLAVIARMIRYVVIFEIAKALYPFVHPFVRRHYARLLILSVMIFTLMLLKVVSNYS